MQLSGTFTSPLDAINVLKSTPCDLVILDIEMPEIEIKLNNIDFILNQAYDLGEAILEKEEYRM